MTVLMHQTVMILSNIEVSVTVWYMLLSNGCLWKDVIFI